MSIRRQPWFRIPFENRILLVSLAGGVPAMVITAVLLLKSDLPRSTSFIVLVLITCAWIMTAVTLRRRVTFPLRTLSNILEALREGDYSLRASGARDDDVLGEAFSAANALSDSLRERRVHVLEVRNLLRKVIDGIDVAIFTFDHEDQLQLLNKRGEQLLGQDSESVLNRSAKELGMATCLTGTTPRILELEINDGVRRWELRRGPFREGGLPHQLVFLADLTRTLHEEDRRAWERLVGVLRHEMNNSLAPICSIAGSLRGMLKEGCSEQDWGDDLRQGLDIILTRSEALQRFVEAYSKVTKLPEPRRRPINIRECVMRVVELESRDKILVEDSLDVTVLADSDQIEQLLINITRNALDAVNKTGGTVKVGWKAEGETLRLYVDDEGTGLNSDIDPFVPFLTTKPDGAGIGLALSRQIAEAHGGSLSLRNRNDGPGCRALLILPLAQKS